MKIKRILTAFLAVAISATAFSAISPIEASAEDYGTAYIMFANGMCKQDKAGDISGAVNPTITGDGSYTTSVPIDSPASSILLLLVQTDIMDTDYPDMKITVDSVLFDGEKIAYTQSDDAFKMEDKSGYRVNIFNEWGNDTKDIDNKVSVESSIEINFTVSGLATTSDTSSSSSTTDSTSSSNSDSSSSSSSSNSDSSSSSSSSSSSTSSTTATTKTTATTTKTADGTPPTGNAGVAGIIALAGLASVSAFIVRKKK